MPATPSFPNLPETNTAAAWKRYASRLNAVWGAYSIRTLGWGEGVVGQRVETADCLDRERAAGRIR